MKSKIVIITISALFLMSCKDSTNDLLSTKNIAHWRGYNMESIPNNWVISEGALKCISKDYKSHAEIIFSKPFKNFELQFEWKIDEAGNSGVMYHSQEGKQYLYAYETGEEYQILDDSFFPNLGQEFKTASCFGMYAGQTKGRVKKHGEWNQSKIIYNNGHTEYYLNGQKVLEYKKDNDWQKRKENSKWNDFKNFGNANEGFFAFQDHGHPIEFKSIIAKALE